MLSVWEGHRVRQVWSADELEDGWWHRCVWGRGGALGDVAAIGSDRTEEFVERGGDAALFAESVDTEFVVTAAQVLHERMTADHDARRAVGL